MGFERAAFVDDVDEELICSVCMDILQQLYARRAPECKRELPVLPRAAAGQRDAHPESVARQHDREAKGRLPKRV